MTYTYKPTGVCAQQIDLAIADNGTVEDIKFYGGCDGNHKGIISLVKGMKIDDVIDRLEGIKCNMRSTSCPDQLAQALKEIKSNKE